MRPVTVVLPLVPVTATKGDARLAPRELDLGDRRARRASRAAVMSGLCGGMPGLATTRS